MLYSNSDMATSYAGAGSIIGNFIDNSSNEDGGAIRYYDYGGCGGHYSIASISGNFIGNNAPNGGAISLSYVNDNMVIGSISGSFLGNYAKSETGTAVGGAIYMGDGNRINITAAEGNTTVFMGNLQNLRGYVMITQYMFPLQIILGSMEIIPH